MMPHNTESKTPTKALKHLNSEKLCRLADPPISMQF